MKNEHIFPDPLDDGIGELIEKINNRKAWTGEIESYRNDLIKLLKKKKYIYFRGHPYRYGLMTIGSSYIYDVPKNKRGHLSKFRGKSVRILVIDSGRFDRGLMAGIYNPTKQPN